MEYGAWVWNLEPGYGILSLGVESGAWVWNLDPRKPGVYSVLDYGLEYGLTFGLII